MVEVVVMGGKDEYVVVWAWCGARDGNWRGKCILLMRTMKIK